MDLVAERGQPDETPPNFVVRLAKHSFVRFLVVGGLSAGVDTGVVFVLHGLLGVDPQPAKMVSTVVAFFFNFTLNRMWSFGSSLPAGKQLVYYGILAVANWGFGVIVFPWLVSLGVQYVIANLLTIGVASILNYIGYRYWVFRK
ncbi:GtrA family protein [Kutzneria buriramensis]|nr:GtrA family protein [Kutzneria buriramensis]